MDKTVKQTAKKDAFLYTFNHEEYELMKQKGFRLEI